MMEHLHCLICGERSELVYLMSDVAVGENGRVNVVAICGECYEQVEEHGFACRPHHLAAFAVLAGCMS